MAEGRMLKRKITKSKKLAALKTDKARLLWFYMLPFTDVEGRIEADPEDIRDEILRKQRKGFSLDRITQCLQDLHGVGLITLYTIGGRQYLEFARFSDEQNLRPDKEAKSEISAPSTGVVRERDGSSTAISKVKISKDKLSKYSADFETFWKRFKGRWNQEKGRYVKVGKYEAAEEFEKLTPLEQQKAIAVADRVGGKYTPDACRWLKRKLFDDFSTAKGVSK